MRFRRLKCAGNLPRRSSAVKPTAALRGGIGTPRFSAILGGLGHHEFAAGGAPNRVGGGILTVPAVQVFEAIPNRPNDEGGKQQFWKAEAKHLKPVSRPNRARLKVIQQVVDPRASHAALVEADAKTTA